MSRAVLAALGLCVLAGAVALAAAQGPHRAALKLVRIAHVSEPVHIAAPRSEPNNLYIVEKGGRIRVRVGARLRARPFLDVSRLVSTGSEQGLLSVAFHPRYARNHLFYVDYTDRAGDTHVVEYRSRGLTAAPKRSRQILFVDQPYANHNGGQLAFGPDGYLYVGMGDGGSGGDPENRAQNLGSLLGKLLRINVNLSRPRPVIVGYGLRNPWRFSFDRRTGDLYIGDVGQDSWEEVDFTRRRTRRTVPSSAASSIGAVLSPPREAATSSATTVRAGFAASPHRVVLRRETSRCVSTVSLRSGRTHAASSTSPRCRAATSTSSPADQPARRRRISGPRWPRAAYASAWSESFSDAISRVIGDKCSPSSSRRFNARSSAFRRSSRSSRASNWRSATSPSLMRGILERARRLHGR